MAISKQTVDYGLLDIWREIMLESPWHFNQVTGTGAPLNTPCSVWIQPQREAIARALHRAFVVLENALEYAILPYWTSEDIPLQRGVPLEYQELQLNVGMIQAYGQKATSLIGAAQAVVYSDVDNDGIDDTGTVTIVSAIDPDEIMCIFQVADGALSAGNEQWRIQPLIITSLAGTITITGHRSLFVKPSAIWDIPYKITDPNRTDKNAGNTQTAANFVTAVDVYRIYTDTSVPAQFKADPLQVQNNALDTWLTTNLVVLPYDNRIGTFRVRTPNCPSCMGYPERVTVWYKAGYPLINQHMDYDFAEAVVRLANCLYPQELPDDVCERTRAMWQRDRQPMEAELLNTDTVRNPFGLMRGQVQAWYMVVDRALGRGGKVP